ncbi:MAG TPA: Stp1/IreP family PP2C-type Ser/Thr phosphatase [Acidimicrobiales bacterium]|nr:Stp1/IreP family PP2C-type Ser/Thr phosphatase [Acidimicrobiales bacterium]
MTVLRSGTATDTGLVRSSNQDLGIATSSLFAVADGMGGHAGGEVASQVAIDALQQAFGEHPSGPGLADAVLSANTAVWVASQERADLRGMGTTLTAVALVNEGGRDVLALVNVGDSRSYRFHDGELTQITTDHSLAEEMVRNGEITPAEAMVHPHRHILTRALGVSPEVDADLWRIRPEQGDRYLLCSDGLTNELSDGEITEILSSIHSPQEAVEKLVEAARDHGGSDNITAVLVDVIIGDADAGTTPVVMPVEPGAFGDDPSASGGDAHAQPASALDPSTAAPGASSAFRESDTLKGRERRRARRRERRQKGARRLLTFRALLVVVILAAVIYGAFYAVRWYNNSSYFVKSHHNQLVIYQGRIGGFLWYHPVPVQNTGVRPSDVPAPYLPSITAGVQESSLADAQKYVRNLKAAQKSTQTTTPPPVPTTTTTTTTTTTVPGQVPTTAPATTAAGGI